MSLSFILSPFQFNLYILLFLAFHLKFNIFFFKKIVVPHLKLIKYSIFLFFIHYLSIFFYFFLLFFIVNLKEGTKGILFIQNNNFFCTIIFLMKLIKSFKKWWYGANIDIQNITNDPLIFLVFQLVLYLLKFSIMVF